jgi:hypothetical protein
VVWYLRAISAFLIFHNIFILLVGILKNPGIPQQIIDNLLKNQMGKGESTDLEEGVEKTSFSDEEETESDSIRMRKSQDTKGVV